ncbi:hypothetical protein [Micrococcus luteus]|uniref:hypothetical protein n=1 Tax=Micrococcus luteus TaxID=1270 RepID=UPI00066643E5|nr:hypothetical protein [Micrococcus luteus]MBY0170740.1 hypothetical protein [Micrococcus luteus]MBY0173144.1 hypothetical protein [Micrococcus luteus]MBY0179902.1 hypothetical protein [Micrococcus luteus]MCV7449145.1 hypothetical protein [Micrococcus luteus]MCV7465085.1 hypothetical protein [Micrococcus luteus]
MTATLEAPQAMGRTLSAVPPVLESPAPQSAAFRQRCALLAMSAARAVTVFPEVAEARFAITGTPSAPALEVDCILRDGEDTAAVIETITVHLVEDLEELLGARFHERRLELVLDRSLPRVGVGVVSAP